MWTGILCTILGIILGGLFVGWLAVQFVIEFFKELFGVKDR